MDNTIKINRGNTLRLDFDIVLDDGSQYIFKQGDVITFAIYEAYGLERNTVAFKSFEANEGDTIIKIVLSKEEMKIGDMISSEREYWYEITLNEETVLGFDDNGPKKLILYPEGREPENAKD